MKIIKWLVIAILLFFASIAIYLTVFFNINDFKPQVVEAVKKQTGRDLAINQDLSWSFFPTLGINIGAITFSNPASFNPVHMLEVNQATASVAFMPLLSKQVELKQLTLDGLTINLVTNKQGKTSFDGLHSTKPAATSDSAPDVTKTDQQAGLNGFAVGAVSLTNIQINLIDQQQDSKQSFKLNSFTLSQFMLGQVSDMAYEFEVQLPEITLTSTGSGQFKISQDQQNIIISELKMANLAKGDSLPNQALEANFTSDIAIDLGKQQMAIDLTAMKLLDIEVVAKVAVNYANAIPVIKADLDFGDIDLDSLLPKDDSQASTASTVPKEVVAEQEPDLSALKTLDVTVNLTAKSIKVSNLVTKNWQMKTRIKNGIVDINKLSAELYEGKLALNAKLDARNKVPSYQFENSLSGVQIRPLMTDLAEMDLLSGHANFTAKGNGKSLKPSSLKQNLLANGQFEITDGSLYGVNIPQMIRSAQKKLSGDLSASDVQELKTDFTSLTGTFSLKEGLFNNPDLAMSSPLIRINGKGGANILTEEIDYQLTTKIVGSLTGQGDSTSMAGIDIPLSISGSFKQPKFGLDTEALMKGQLKQEADKAKDKLKDSLFKKLGAF
ncbi:AsmA family protein [Shewanella aestuarii]|uniref:AsmA family protein n=1 Tax=Shewanella aestuarii TaxID=1028752 RepID=A0A6G9QK91_9GAMM|nr:AsmA family protein [Shewanella aestuarii]QIR14553.1 AsmA family protein [Shewanella aestuarii]